MINAHDHRHERDRGTRSGRAASRRQVAAALAGDRGLVMSAPTVAECLIVLTARHGPVARTIFERLCGEIGLGVTPFTGEEATAAQRADLQYGKGRHPAALNFGDCLTYAAAQVRHEPLIVIGNEFSPTDLQFSGVIGYWPTPSSG